MVLSCIILCIAFALGHVLPLTAGCGQQHFHKGRRIAEESDTSAWNYDLNGADWPGTCKEGRAQSPIAIQLTAAAPFAGPPISFEFGKAKGLRVFNIRTAIQVEWDDLEGSQTVIPTNGMWGSDAENISSVPVKPFQFHWHSTCEHIVDGFMCPLELHLVTKVDNETDAPVPRYCQKNTCLAVFGVTFEYNADDVFTGTVPFMEGIVESLPSQDDVVAQDATFLDTTFDLNTLIPSNSSYAWYQGSLTAPPCWEGVSWHVFTDPMEGLSVPQLEALQSALASHPEERELTCSPDEDSGCGVTAADCTTTHGSRTNNRALQPTNGRQVFLASAA
ncbi:Carbonic anhydrase 2 [Auxenochlorella protothecoides]|uniref:carbonic anhydrase n=1 Tax=Auxenochlorella protothecoides TaxID=3075 RepID=A0A087SNR5_AUXPR|nr:Carbonic anhydrase 2 [Auxenochlorella protothecoides]KFM27369.1 Carbonic anhydrase 2 [Auxenochlorella protothecoides]RMZ57515.1 hypothetical protein APUTEX25_003758 [Auxenochlorella protothecoides]|eukprot:RMZ57515.1 hypothetical protein APUTEX25_003758 [Auxenochlorella protothecoides]